MRETRHAPRRSRQDTVKSAARRRRPSPVARCPSPFARRPLPVAPSPGAQRTASKATTRGGENQPVRRTTLPAALQATHHVTRVATSLHLCLALHSVRPAGLPAVARRHFRRRHRSRFVAVAAVITATATCTASVTLFLPRRAPGLPVASQPCAPARTFRAPGAQHMRVCAPAVRQPLRSSAVRVRCRYARERARARAPGCATVTVLAVAVIVARGWCAALMARRTAQRTSFCLSPPGFVRRKEGADKHALTRTHTHTRIHTQTHTDTHLLIQLPSSGGKSVRKRRETQRKPSKGIKITSEKPELAHRPLRVASPHSSARPRGKKASLYVCTASWT